MDKGKKLLDLFENDPLGLLNIKPSASPARNEDERLVETFQEINAFYEKNNRAPEQGNGVAEHQLYSRLKGIREHPLKVEMLKYHDRFGLLDYVQKPIQSLDDVLNDDILGLLDDDAEGLFDLQHIGQDEERASADFVARRKPCTDFEKYEPVFQEIQKDLSVGKRKLLAFKEENLREGDFYVHNGILLLLEQVDFQEEVQPYKSGSRYRKDGRTRVVFENGTESNMLYRSLYKALLDNGKVVSKNADEVNQSFLERFSNITDDDQEAGFIYILKSKSDKQEIRDISHLYKIGFSKRPVEDRIKNAAQEPTFLMADVRIVMTWKCYNLNPQKLEQLLHNFFGRACLNIDVFDKAGNRHTPREWFIAPLDVVEQAVNWIISGEILEYRYNVDSGEIEKR
jgi:hypothetical protein